jgi:hypothetical protein
MIKGKIMETIKMYEDMLENLEDVSEKKIIAQTLKTLHKQLKNVERKQKRLEKSFLKPKKPPKKILTPEEKRDLNFKKVYDYYCK